MPCWEYTFQVAYFCPVRASIKKKIAGSRFSRVTSCYREKTTLGKSSMAEERGGKKKGFERTDVCFVAALMGSDRFRLCNDVKKSDMRPRV